MAGSSLLGIASASRVSNILHKGRDEGSHLRVVSRTLPVKASTYHQRKNQSL